MSLEQVDWNKIPAPEDDGACDHLTGLRIPSITLKATDNSSVDISHLTGRTVVYIYPMTGRPDTPLPNGWDSIPARQKLRGSNLDIELYTFPSTHHPPYDVSNLNCK